MLVCVDTNVMLHAFARSSAWVPLFKAIGAGKLRLALSTSIVLEYEEVCAQRGGTAFIGKVMGMLTLVSSIYGSIVWVTPAISSISSPLTPATTCSPTAQSQRTRTL